MKHIKKFESLDEPQVGDYVACEESWMFAVSEFISNNVGILKFKHDYDYEYAVEYDNIPKEFSYYFDHLNFDHLNFDHLEYDMGKGSGDCREMIRDEIKFWSKDKSEVEDYIEAKKYNL